MFVDYTMSGKQLLNNKDLINLFYIDQQQMVDPFDWSSKSFLIKFSYG